MHTDAHFIIGRTHKICQDYAIAGEVKGVPYGVVCDGCSTARDTDCGARIAAKAHVESLPDNRNFHLAIVNDEKSLFDPTALYVTFLNFEVLEKYIIAHMLGDGVVAAKKRNSNDYVIESISYKQNAPFYVGYYLDDEKANQWSVDYPDNQKIITRYTIKSGVIEKTERVSDSLTEKVLFPKEEYDQITIMSDGIHSFRKPVDTNTTKITEMIPFTDFIQELLAFKSVDGEFVHRRMNKFLKTHPTWTHDDDFSMATLIL